MQQPSCQCCCVMIVYVDCSRCPVRLTRWCLSTSLAVSPAPSCRRACQTTWSVAGKQKRSVNLPYAESFNRSERCTHCQFHNLPPSSTHSMTSLTGLFQIPFLGIGSSVICLENVTDRFCKAFVSVRYRD